MKAGLFEDVSDIWAGVAAGMMVSCQPAWHMQKSMTIGGRQWGVHTPIIGGVYITGYFQSWALPCQRRLTICCRLCKAEGKWCYTYHHRIEVSVGTAGVFDYLDLRVNGYEFHMDLTNGKIPYANRV